MISSSKLPIQADREQKRHFISTLYMTPGYTLNEVMQTMKQCGFDATVKMYKTRFSKWGLIKNLNQDEMRAIAIKARELDQRDRHSIFYIRNKKVTYNSVARHCKRRGITIDELIAEGSSLRTLSNRQRRNQNSSAPYSSPTIAIASVPLAMAVPELAAYRIHNYIRGSFGNNTWLSTSETEFAFSSKAADSTMRSTLRSHIEVLGNKVFMGCVLISKKFFKEGFQNLDIAMIGIKEIVQLESPRLFIDLPRIILGVTAKHHMYKIAILILKQFARFAELYHGRYHPLYHFYRLLASLENSKALEHAIQVTASSIRDAFNLAIGPLHRTSLAAQLTCTRLSFVHAENSVRTAGYLEALHRCEAQLPVGDPRILKARREIDLFLGRTNQFHQMQGTDRGSH